MSYELCVTITIRDNVLDPEDFTRVRYALIDGKAYYRRTLQHGVYHLLITDSGSINMTLEELIETLTDDPTGTHPEVWCEYSFSIEGAYPYRDCTVHTSYSRECFYEHFNTFVHSVVLHRELHEHLSAWHDKRGPLHSTALA